jgi:hypothetical protein
MKENQLKALLKKTQAKAAQVKKPANKGYDPTLQATRPATDDGDNSEAKEIFKEMKRREF